MIFLKRSKLSSRSAAAPQRHSYTAEPTCTAFRCVFSVLFLLLLSTTLSSCSRVGSGPSPVLEGTDGPTGATSLGLLTVSPAKLEFGQVHHAGRSEKNFTLHNAGRTIVTVVEITTSCDCLSIRLENSSVEPGRSVNGVVSVDFSIEPEFSGELDLSAYGRADGNRGSAFVLGAHMHVE